MTANTHVKELIFTPFCLECRKSFDSAEAVPPHFIELKAGNVMEASHVSLSCFQDGNNVTGGGTWKKLLPHPLTEVCVCAHACGFKLVQWIQFYSSDVWYFTSFYVGLIKSTTKNDYIWLKVFFKRLLFSMIV